MTTRQRMHWCGAVGVVVLIGAACTGREEKAANGDLKLSGTVHMVQATDGSTCWKLESSKGKSYELQPAQAPHDMLVDGAHAFLEAKPREGGSFCKVGQIVDVTQLDSVQAPAATASRE
ncbi:MAG TPA: hypothetical protein VFJ96_00610 [Gemmatimonadaceae bacterium]|nr:hypothetical protein [Gemmatimonadaceae bacterium]